MAHRVAPTAERGFTLVELAVSMFVASVVVMGTSMFMISISQIAVRAQASVTSIDQAKLATEGIDRQVTSALVIYDPSTESANAGTNPDGSAIPSGFSLRVYTESNSTYQCTQWRLLNTGSLQSRNWQPYWASGLPVTGWVTLATGVTNLATNPPFVLDTNTGFGGPGGGGGTNSGRLLDLNLVSSNTQVAYGPVQLSSSVDGRDVGYLPPNANACSSVPPA